MSGEVEAGGALVTAALVAAQIDGHSGTHAAHDRHGHCLNCGQVLAGAYCAHCGQSSHIHRSVLHLAEELLHGLFHFDAKGWRTMPLLVWRPGLLTRRYIDGQRARYVSPLALFLFMVFLVFFVFSFTTVQPATYDVNPRTRAQVVEALKRADASVVAARASLAEAQRKGESTAKAQAALTTAEASQRALQETLQHLDAPAAHPAASAAPSSVSPAASSAAGDDRTIVLTVPVKGLNSPDWVSSLRSSHIETGYAWIDSSIQHALDNPELTLYKLKGTASKYSFMLVPISLPFLWLMFFWRPGIQLYDHAVFALYSLSFMSLLAIAGALLEKIGLESIAGLLFFVPPVHMYRQLREAYGLSVGSTLWRTAALLVVAFLVFVLYLLFIVAMTMG